MPYTVAVLVGSLRKESFNRKLANNLVAVAPPSLTFEFIDISHISSFNQDLEATPPQDWVDLRNRIRPCDAVLFVTPEYNRSVPGVLKNAIDVASRPYGQSVWDKKPAAVISGSMGAIGGFGANHHLRQSLAYLNMPTVPQPEAYLGNLSDAFDENGNCKNEKTRQFLQNFANAFAAWIEVHVKK